MAFKIISVVGARPNFMKVAAICEAIKEHNRQGRSPSIDHVLVHTGQHYDANMSDLFFNDLELPKPNLFLGVGSGSHSTQTAKVMEGFENVLLAEKAACRDRGGRRKFDGCLRLGHQKDLLSGRHRKRVHS